MRSGEERGYRPEGLHQVSDQSDLTGLRKNHSKQYGDGTTNQPTNRRTDTKLSYRVATAATKNNQVN